MIPVRLMVIMLMGTDIIWKLMPVTSSHGDVVHLLEVTDSVEWVPGEKSKAICNREGKWFFSGIVIPGDRPCEKCDKKSSVVVAMFLADKQAKELAQDEIDHQFHHWLEQGVDSGFISLPSCYFHGGDTFLTSDEEIQVNDHGEPDHCVFIVRVFDPGKDE